MTFQELYDKKKSEQLQDTKLFQFIESLIQHGCPNKTSTTLIDEIYDSIKNTNLIHIEEINAIGIIDPATRKFAIESDPIKFKLHVSSCLKQVDHVEDIIAVGYREYSAERCIGGKVEYKLVVKHLPSSYDVDWIFNNWLNHYSVQHPIMLFVVSDKYPKTCVATAFQDC